MDDQTALADPERQELERLRRALQAIERAAIEYGAELYPVGPADFTYDDDGARTGIVGPWHFLRGDGASLLDAVEDHARR